MNADKPLMGFDNKMQPIDIRFINHYEAIKCLISIKSSIERAEEGNQFIALCGLIYFWYSDVHETNRHLMCLLRTYKPKHKKLNHHWWKIGAKSPRLRVVNKMLKQLEEHKPYV